MANAFLEPGAFDEITFVTLVERDTAKNFAPNFVIIYLMRVTAELRSAV